MPICQATDLSSEQGTVGYHAPIRGADPSHCRPRRFEWVAVTDIDNTFPTRGSRVGLTRLQKSIERHGILAPLIVEAMAENRYSLIAGSRRLEAAALAEMHHVPCLILEDLTERLRSAIALTDNVQREVLAGADRFAAYERLVHNTGSLAEAAALVGVHTKSISRARRLPSEGSTSGAREALPVQDALEAISNITSRLSKLTATDRHDLVDAARELIRIAESCGSW